MRTLTGLLLVLGLLGCGGGDDDDDGGGDGGGGGADASDDPCGFGSDRYLPFEVGFTWSYEITDLSSGERAVKEQSVDQMIEDPDFGEVLVQTTGKLDGSTRSLFSIDGDRVVRRQQEDLDGAGELERTTVYDPGQVRLDETPARLETGATYEEAYDETVTLAGGGPVTVATVDAWEVIDGEASCDTPLGTVGCVRLRRTRTAGGTAVKEFYFARGIGKIRESGENQLEELTACGP